MKFDDRKDAGMRLAEALEKFKSEEPVVFALSKGGVVLAAEIASKLDAPLDMIFVKKIGHPENSEFTICAMADDGPPVCTPDEIQKISSKWLDKEIDRGRREIRKRREKYFGAIASRDVEGRTVIIVDDGIATGLSVRAGILEMKERKPKRLVIAIPVVPSPTSEILKPMVDELVSLMNDPHYLGIVGLYYEHFNPVDDEEVVTLLRSVSKK